MNHVTARSLLRNYASAALAHATAALEHLKDCNPHTGRILNAAQDKQLEIEQGLIRMLERRPEPRLFSQPDDETILEAAEYNAMVDFHRSPSDDRDLIPAAARLGISRIGLTDDEIECFVPPVDTDISQGRPVTEETQGDDFHVHDFDIDFNATAQAWSERLVAAEAVVDFRVDSWSDDAARAMRASVAIADRDAVKGGMPG